MTIEQLIIERLQIELSNNANLLKDWGYMDKETPIIPVFTRLINAIDPKKLDALMTELKTEKLANLEKVKSNAQQVIVQAESIKSDLSK